MRLPRPGARPTFPRGVATLLMLTQIGVWLTFLLASRRGPASTVTIVFTVIVIVFASFRVILGALHPARSMRVVLYLAAHALSVLTADFAFIYWRSGTRVNWGMPLSHLDALFLTVGTLTTAGTGGVSPHTEWARGMLTLQMTIDIVVVTLISGLVLVRLAEVRASRTAQA